MSTNGFIFVTKLLWSWVVLFNVKVSCQFDLRGLDFPQGFMFGVATASYQVEGAWNVSGRGVTIWDTFCHRKPNKIANGSSGDVACDSYHKYQEDVDNANIIGFKFYRFSIAWSRLYPNGFADQLNQEGVDYYNRLIDALLAKGIQPMVTLFHWDFPQALQDYNGGWLNPEIIDIFADYARTVFGLYGDRVKWWITINEPITFCLPGYGQGFFPPEVTWNGHGEYICGHNVLRAHSKAYAIYDKEFRNKQQGKVSLIVSGYYYFPQNASSPDDIEAAERGNQFSMGWFGHPVYSKEGNYPKVMIDQIQRNSLKEGLPVSRLPRFTRDEIRELRGSFDYLAFNHYSSMNARTGKAGADPSLERDSEITSTYLPGVQVNKCTWQEIPTGFRGALNWLKKEYNNPIIFVTENGFCGDGRYDDYDRISYHTDYMRQMNLAIKEDGVRVIGYDVWSLMDNFEWILGYTIKYGLISVDFNDPQRTRTMRVSANFFKELIAKQNQGPNSTERPTYPTERPTNPTRSPTYPTAPAKVIEKPIIIVQKQDIVQKPFSNFQLPSFEFNPSLSLDLKKNSSLGLLFNRNHG